MKEISGYTYYIKRVFSMPPHIVVKKACIFFADIISSKVDKIKVRTFKVRLSNAAFFNALTLNSTEFFEGLKKRPAFFLSDLGLSALKDMPRQNEQEARAVISGADKICEHKFDILGSGEVFLGKKIDWHIDFKTGYKWSHKTYYKDIAIPYNEGDIKVPWELSRFQHLPLLGQAYQITGQEKYVLEFKEQVSDWIRENPVKFGPNWTCTMDVAIRASNWLVAWEFFKSSPLIDDSFILKFFKNILLHARFIRNNLEYSEDLTSNHYLADIAGLFFIACMVPEFKESEEWLSFSQKELESEIKKQVYEDGCDFEASTCYHRLVLEFFFYSALLGDKAGEKFSSGYLARLEKMFDAVVYLLKPNGKMPQIGDNDSGRFFIFECSSDNDLDMRYLLWLGLLFFKQPGFNVFQLDQLCPAILILFGPNGLEQIRKYSSDLKEIESHAFQDAGWYVMRNENDYLLISCGPNGQKNNGGHGHNDKLSFELCLGGEDIIVDPGSYLYTIEPKMRNTFRSTNYHNTIEVAGVEQNRFHKEFLFVTENDAKAEVLRFEILKTGGYFKGRHFGYNKSSMHIIHEREFRFVWEEKRIYITDILSGTGNVSFRMNLHLFPGVIAEAENHCAELTTVSGQKVLICFPEEERLITEDYWYSTFYGKKESAKSVFIKKNVNLPCEISWMINFEQM